MSEHFDFVAARAAVLGSPLRAVSKLVLLVLIEHAPKMRPGIGRLMAMSSLSRRCVLYELEHLEASGLLTIYRRRGLVNSYRLASDWVAMLADMANPQCELDFARVHHVHGCTPCTGAPDARGVVHVVHGGSARGARVPVHVVHPKQEEKQEEKQEAEAATRPQERARRRQRQRQEAAPERENQTPQQASLPLRGPLASPTPLRSEPPIESPRETRRETSANGIEFSGDLLGAIPEGESERTLDQRRRESRIETARRVTRELPIADLARYCREHPTNAAMVDVHLRPEVVRVHEAWAEAVGLPNVPLAPYSRSNRQLANILTLLEQVPLERILRACEIAETDPWCRGEMPSDGTNRRHGIEDLSMVVLRKLLEQDEPDVDPRVSAMLEEERRRYSRGNVH